MNKSLNTCGTTVYYMLDTGAQANLVPEKVYKTYTDGEATFITN